VCAGQLGAKVCGPRHRHGGVVKSAAKGGGRTGRLDVLAKKEKGK
jgi:hypothetical protein